jgi:hypothetical protein
LLRNLGKPVLDIRQVGWGRFVDEYQSSQKLIYYSENVQAVKNALCGSVLASPR